MINFCTLFDSNFINYGLVLHDSLEKTKVEYTLFILAFDDKCYAILKKLALKNVTVISLAEFEDEELIKIKPTRSKGEYCWTSTPSVIKYCIETFNLSHCIYIDADLYFYTDPTCLIEEAAGKSIIITPHWYHPRWDTSAITGRFCVQFVYFKSDDAGKQALSWWRDACLKWCYNRLEDGKFGDQLYLQDWEKRFPGVHVLENRGGGVGPWNALNYKFTSANNFLLNNTEYNLIFYHFHGLKFFENTSNEEIVSLGTYKLPATVKQKIYTPYIQKLIKKREELAQLGFKQNGAGSSVINNTIPFIDKVKRILLGNYNRHKLKNILKNGTPATIENV